MDIPITNPHLSANLEDNSKVDDSFNQAGTTVNLGAGATYNQNCGNQKADISNRSARRFSLICDAIIVISIIIGVHWMSSKIGDKIGDKFDDFEKKSEVIHQKMMNQAKEGTIWLLRDDIIKTIDFHEATKTITQKQFKRVKDEYEYYTSIGGNHDVKDRFDDFYAKIFGTGEVKMVASENKKMER